MKEQPKKPEKTIGARNAIRRLDVNWYYSASIRGWTERVEDATVYDCDQAGFFMDGIADDIHKREGKIVRLEIVPLDLVPRW